MINLPAKKRAGALDRYTVLCGALLERPGAMRMTKKYAYIVLVFRPSNAYGYIRDLMGYTRRYTVLSVSIFCVHSLSVTM